MCLREREALERQAVVDDERVLLERRLGRGARSGRERALVGRALDEERDHRCATDQPRCCVASSRNAR